MTQEERCFRINNVVDIYDSKYNGDQYPFQSTFKLDAGQYKRFTKTSVVSVRFNNIFFNSGSLRIT